MKKSVFELLKRQRELQAQMASSVEDKEAFGRAESEYKANAREIEMLNQEAVARKASPEVKLDRNKAFRSWLKSIGSGGQVTLARANSQTVVTSGILASGDVNNMESAGLPVTVQELVNPLEMDLVYEQLGLKIATGVKGQIIWPCLDTAAKVTVAGEAVAASKSTLDFSKIVATPVKLTICIEVSLEAFNDASFDLYNTIVEQMNLALGRTLNEAVLKTTKFNAKFYGPLAETGIQTVSFAASGAPTYAELLSMKGKVLGSGAKMAGFCYVMDAAMASQLEATPIDNGSGLMIIQNGKINGAPVIVTDVTGYTGKVAAGCFGYAALNQHGDSLFTPDWTSQADRGVARFTLNSDWSLTTLKKAPFVIGS